MLKTLQNVYLSSLRLWVGICCCWFICERLMINLICVPPTITFQAMTFKLWADGPESSNGMSVERTCEIIFPNIGEKEHLMFPVHKEKCLSWVKDLLLWVCLLFLPVPLIICPKIVYLAILTIDHTFMWSRISRNSISMFQTKDTRTRHPSTATHSHTSLGPTPY